MPNEPIAHLVWLQGRRAPDDVEDYYEVARPGDKSVDGSDPFPVYASPSDAERHERAIPDIALINDLQRHIDERGATTEIGQDIQCAIEVIRALSAPPPPAAVQETATVKLEVKPSAFEVLDHENGVYLTRSEQAAINSGFEYNGLYRRSALSTSQSDPTPAPEIAALQKAFDERTDKLLELVEENGLLKGKAATNEQALNSYVREIAALRAENERLRKLGQSFANQVRHVTHLLNGQAYSSTVSELNAFDATLRAAVAPEQEEAE
jgi:hypothetical protein